MNAEPLLVPRKAAARLLGVSDRTWTRIRRMQPGFPAPLRLVPGGQELWIRAELLRWVDAEGLRARAEAALREMARDGACAPHSGQRG